MCEAQVLFSERHASLPLQSPLPFFSAVAARDGSTISVTITCLKSAFTVGTPLEIKLTASEDGCSAFDTMNYTLKATSGEPTSSGTSACLGSGTPSVHFIFNFTVSAAVGDNLTLSAPGLTNCKMYDNSGATGGCNFD